MKKFMIMILASTLIIVAGCQSNNNAEQIPDKAETALPQAETTSSQTETASPKQPESVVKKIVISDQGYDDCGSPMNLTEPSQVGHHADIMADGNVSFWGEAYITAEISEENDGGFTAEWYLGKTDGNPRFQENFSEGGAIDRYVTEWVFHSSQKATPTKACDGKLYLHLKSPSLESGFGAEGTYLEPRKIIIRFNNEFVGEKLFYFQQ